jgi:hypothetical protein
MPLLGFFAKSALMTSPIGGFLKSLTPRAWLWIGIIAALFVGFLVHQHKAKQAIADAYSRGSVDAYAKVEKKAREVEAKALALNHKIIRHLKDENHAENSRIRADAGALLVRGPGAARCSDSALSGLSRGHEPATRPADAPLPRVPYAAWSDLIAMPFPDAVAFAREHDLNLAEVKACRSAWTQLSAAWESLRQSEGPKE